jgi:hypothetical protein
MTSPTMLSTYSNHLPTVHEWDLLKEQSKSLLASGLLPKGITKPEQVILIVLKGKELQIPPLQALSHIHVINGKPCMSAELMLAQIYRLHPKTVIKFKERSGERCVVEAKRDGHGVETFAWSLEDAKKAGITGNPTWSKYPRAMLHARVVSEMARSLFPDAIAGISYTPEELGAEVDESGDVIDISPTPTPTAAPSPTFVPTPAPDVKKDPAIFSNKNSRMVEVAKSVLGKELDAAGIDRALALLEGRTWNKPTVAEIIDVVKFEADVYSTFGGQ